jgi:FkbM family methyltransferase
MVLISPADYSLACRRVFFCVASIDPSPDSQLMNDVYDGQTFEVMKRVLTRNSNCVDVGCHKGDILRGIIGTAPDGIHYAFEPIPSLFESLRTEFPSVHVLNIALSNVESVTSFQHVVSNPGYSGLKRRRYDREGEIVVPITVKTATLDRILPANFQLDFLKIDVEGAEVQVFEGAIETISRNKPFVVFEHGLGASDYYGTTPTAVYDLLTERCGLSISLMEKWLDGGLALTREEFVRQFDTGENYNFLGHP